MAELRFTSLRAKPSTSRTAFASTFNPASAT